MPTKRFVVLSDCIPRLAVMVLENVNVYVYFVETWKEMVDDSSSSSSSSMDDAVPLGETESMRPSFIVREILVD